MCAMLYCIQDFKVAISLMVSSPLCFFFFFFSTSIIWVLEFLHWFSKGSLLSYFPSLSFCSTFWEVPFIYLPTLLSTEFFIFTITFLKKDFYVLIFLLKASFFCLVELLSSFILQRMLIISCVLSSPSIIFFFQVVFSVCLASLFHIRGT